MKARVEFKLQDFWVGVFWKTSPMPPRGWSKVDLWICFVPCLPIHFEWERHAPDPNRCPTCRHNPCTAPFGHPPGDRGSR